MDSSAYPTAEWRTSSASGGTNCVEVAFVAGAAMVRDSKDRDGAVLTFPNESWLRFVAAVNKGRF